MSNIYQLNNIGFYYGDNSSGGFNLSDVNINIQDSNLIALVGPNGSGKTSLLNILAFLESPKEGILIYKDKKLEQSNHEQFRSTVGYVQQSPYLLRGSVFKNIELGLKLRKVDKENRVKKVNEIMQLLDIAHLSSRAAKSLSGGEAQKVAIGQVLVLDPDVLICDEPFTHLDKQSINELEKILLALKNDFNKTIIFTTHDQIQAQWLADDVYSVINGKVFKAYLINLFSGIFNAEKNTFKIGSILINMPGGVEQAEQIAIDPRQIVVSQEKLDSSMQNSFPGKISGMAEENDKIKLNINIGEEMHAIITHKALDKLKLSIGSDVWISFKSSSIVIF